MPYHYARMLERIMHSIVNPNPSLNDWPPSRDAKLTRLYAVWNTRGNRVVETFKDKDAAISLQMDLKKERPGQFTLFSGEDHPQKVDVEVPYIVR